METTKPDEVLDRFLEYFVNLQGHGGKAVADVGNELNYSPLKEVIEIIGKLKKDGYVWHDYPTELNPNYGEPAFTSTFEGRMFLQNGGYRAKALQDAAFAEEQRLEIARLKSVDVSSDLNQKTLNTLTGRLVLATWFAFGAAVALLIWQVVQYWLESHTKK